jgi:hypothetical protein
MQHTPRRDFSRKKLARSIHFQFHYADTVLSLNEFCDNVGFTYPIEQMETTDTARSAAYHDLHNKLDSEHRLLMKLYNKRDDFNFLIEIFPLACSSSPAAPAYVCISLYLLPGFRR